jgi:hypothetical protein
VRYFVEGLEIVGSALVFLFIARMLYSAELYASSALQIPEGNWRFRETPFMAVNLKASINDAFELRIFTPEDDAAFVFASSTEYQVRLASSSRAPVKEKISWTS